MAKKELPATARASNGAPAPSSTKKGEETPAGDEEEESYDEEEDEDYDPTAKPADKKAGGGGGGSDDDDDDEEDEDDKDGNEPVPEFSAIESGEERLVKTRRQRQEEELYGGDRKSIPEGLVRANKYSSIDVDELFNQLKEQSVTGEPLSGSEALTASATPSHPSEGQPQGQQQKQQQQQQSKQQSGGTGGAAGAKDGDPEMITIESSYTFAGKVITETKLVEVGSAEAKAYLNSTGNITKGEAQAGAQRSYVPVVREVNGEHLELRIKLKRPSLIDKYLSLQGNKSQKLSTLEKSRLDWASFVDKRKLQDDLKTHNKAGYLDRQEFLNRVESHRDQQYQKAKEEDRKNRLQNEGSV